MKKGFTLIELLVIIVILSTLLALSAPFYSRFILQDALSSTVDQFAGSFRKAQISAMMGKQNGSWGVNYSNNKITLFQGNSYIGRNSGFDEVFNINANIGVTGFTEVIFSRMTGIPGATAFITIHGGGSSKTLSINKEGIVSK